MMEKLEAQQAEPVSITFHSVLRKLNTEPPIGASHHVLVIWLSSQRRYLEIDQSETRMAFGDHVCQWIRTKLAIFIKDLPMMLPTKFRFIWPSGFRVEDRPIRNKNCLWRPCLLMKRDKMCNLQRGLFTDASYQVTVHFAKQFRRRFLEINQSEIRIACGGHVC